MTTCNHEATICPKHDMSFDCTSFCDICEGEQEFCATCDESAKTLADIYQKGKVQPTITMDIDLWEEKYLPIINHLAESASWEDTLTRGVMFDNYGLDWHFIRNTDQTKVWSYMDVDGSLFITSEVKQPEEVVGYMYTEVSKPRNHTLIGMIKEKN